MEKGIYNTRCFLLNTSNFLVELHAVFLLVALPICKFISFILTLSFFCYLAHYLLLFFSAAPARHPYSPDILPCHTWKLYKSIHVLFSVLYLKPNLFISASTTKDSLLQVLQETPTTRNNLVFFFCIYLPKKFPILHFIVQKKLKTKSSKGHRIIVSCGGSGGKGPQEVCNPTSSSKQSQVWVYPGIYPFTFLKISKNGDWTTS